VLPFVEVSLGAGGGVGCERCHGAAAGPTYLDAATVSAAIAEAAAGAPTPGPNVSLAGPEPFGHPELPVLVAAAMRAGVARLRLDTDATALSSSGNAAGAIAAGVRHVRFTLLGGSPGTHDALAGEAGALDATLSGVRAYVRAAAEQDVAVSVTARIPVCRHNVRDVPAAVAVAVEAGAESVLLRIEDGGADLDAATAWLSAACDTGVVNGVWVEIEGVPYCLAPSAPLHIADTFRTRAGTHGPRCAGCPLVSLCAGGPVGASADLLASLAPPDGAAGLAGRVARARGEAS
jgi:hypothetical protein